MFNKYFFKDAHFWIGLIIAYLNRNIFIHVSILNPLWIIDLLLFIAGVYLVISSLLNKKKYKFIK